MITFVVEAKFIIMKHSYLSGISVKEVIRRGTLWMENRVKPDAASAGSIALCTERPEDTSHAGRD